jgi:Cu/Ag efflux pump CusA
MIGIVRLALSRPYTFVVMALLILIFGAMAVVRTPTDIFPNVGSHFGVRIQFEQNQCFMLSHFS